MPVHLHTCSCVHLLICSPTHLCTYAHLHTCLPACLHTPMPVLLCTLNAWMIVPLSACATIHLHICTPASYISAYLQSCIHEHLCTHTHGHVQGCTPACLCIAVPHSWTPPSLCICTPVCLYSSEISPICLQGWIPVYIRIFTLACLNSCTNEHLCVWKPVWSHTCAYMCTNTSVCLHICMLAHMNSTLAYLHAWMPAFLCT